MTTQNFSGLTLARELKGEIKARVKELSEDYGITPCLAVVTCTDDPSVFSYVRSKEKVAAELNIQLLRRSLEPTVKQSELVEEIRTLSHRPDVHGIIVELPLPKGFNVEEILSHITPVKDVDGLTSINRGLVAAGNEEKALCPATPLACIEFAERHGSLAGRRVAVIGRGPTVGRPLAQMLTNRGATVTVCHSATKSIKESVAGCDIIFSATGKAGLITDDIVTSDQVVIDAGVSFQEGKMRGDLSEEASRKVRGYTPTPGGVGPVTTVMLFRNLLRAIELQKAETSFLDYSLRSFLGVVASASPTPGGGSAASMSGLIGIGLVIMALEITSRRKDQESLDEITSLIGELRTVMQLLESVPDEDARCFDSYMAALKLPKENEAQKADRKAALSEASAHATEVPLSAGRLLSSALEMAERAAILAHKNVISDVGAGTSLIGGALEGVLLNVFINSGGKVTEATEEARTLLTGARSKAPSVTRLVYERLGY